MSDPPKRPRPPIPPSVAPNRIVAYSWLGDQIHALRDKPGAVEDARALRFGLTTVGDDVVAYVREDITALQREALREQTIDFIQDEDLGGLRALYGLPREEKKGLNAKGLLTLLGAVGRLLQAGLASKTRPLASLTKAAKGALFLLEQQNIGPFDGRTLDEPEAPAASPPRDDR